MLTHAVKVLEKHYIRIDKRFEKLITSLRTAKTITNNTTYDKQASSYSDLCDCWQMISLMVREDIMPYKKGSNESKPGDKHTDSTEKNQ